MTRAYDIVEHSYDVVMGAGGAGMRAALGMAAARRATETVHPGERHAPTPQAAIDRALARFDRVHLSPLSNEVASIPPKERVY